MKGVVILGAALVLGCGPTIAEVDGGANSSAAAGDESTSGLPPWNDSGTPPDPSTSTGTTGAATFGEDDGSTDDGSVFIVVDDVICGQQSEEYSTHCTPECSLWEQDCPRGEKCMPWANDGGSAWNATRCSPIAENPAGVGEPCVVEGSGVSGIDDCELGAMCWYVDPETNEGTCVALCVGTPENPMCEQPATYCAQSSGPLALCLPTCNPLSPEDCHEGQTCIPGFSDFTCAPIPGDTTGYGEPCEFINECAPGLACLDGETVGCEDASCCAAFCDLTAGNPNPSCPDAAMGQTCVPWYQDGKAPVGYENLGVCVLE